MGGRPNGSSVPGWDAYWLNSYNPWDSGPAGEAARSLATAIIQQFADQAHRRLTRQSRPAPLSGEATTVTQVSCAAGNVEVVAVTSLLQGGHHRGDIIQWEGEAEGGLELLVGPGWPVVLVPGHQVNLGRQILSLQLGNAWDEREKILRHRP